MPVTLLEKEWQRYLAQNFQKDLPCREHIRKPLWQSQMCNKNIKDKLKTCNLLKRRFHQESFSVNISECSTLLEDLMRALLLVNCALQGCNFKDWCSMETLLKMLFLGQLVFTMYFERNL